MLPCDLRAVPPLLSVASADRLAQGPEAEEDVRMPGGAWLTARAGTGPGP